MIGCIDRRQKKNRLNKFKISEDLLGNNNAIEGWQNCFTSILNQHHPSIWKSILALKKVKNINEIQIELCITEECPPAKYKYFDKAQRLKNIGHSFKNSTTDEYL